MKTFFHEDEIMQECKVINLYYVSYEHLFVFFPSSELFSNEFSRNLFIYEYIVLTSVTCDYPYICTYYDCCACFV